ncbi:MAG: DUF6064 family protein [Dichotomicrobium sp.]
MDALLGYSLEDLMLFSRETYLRLFELYHRDVWPAQILVGALGIAFLQPVLVGRRTRIRAMLAVLALIWLWVGYAFHLERYATINWAATSFAWLFAAQAGLLLIAAIWPGGLRGGPAWARGTGAAILGFALAVLPLAEIALGRGWREVEFFALTPDATAFATLGVLVALSGAWRWLLALVPLTWCVIGGGTLLAMNSPEAYLSWGAALVALVMLAASAFDKDERMRRQNFASK